MKVLDIRTRMLLAALLPVALVGVLLTLVFLFVRVDDMQVSYQQRIRSVSRQLALASEYGLFSANQMQLQVIANGALREPDVHWVAILDARGQTLVSAGDAQGSRRVPISAREEQFVDPQRRADWLVQPVFSSGIKLDDLYEDAAVRSDGLPGQMGQVVVKFSRQSVIKRQQDMLLLGGLISVIGLLFGMVLAVRLSRGVIRPILRVRNLIERIGQGDFDAARPASDADLAGDPLRDLRVNLQQMAHRLAFAREELEQQVNLVTQALREKKEEAEQANQAKSRFLAAASHDLRQPIHALGMFVTRLAQLQHDPQTGQLIEHLEASVMAMQNLLDGLLDISRLDAQAVQVNKQPFALASLFSQLEQDLAQRASERGLRLRIRPSPVWVMSDATLIYRILLNLVGNALRYTEAGGVLVAARLVRGGEQVRLEVWDTGVGIAPEHQAAVFREFYQVANPARDRSKGLGLGLNIVQRTAALLGHPLMLLSRLGTGSRFSLTLPTTGVAIAASVPLAVEVALPDDLLGKWVLVIEDDILVCAALAGMLAGWGMQVAQAHGLREAQNLVQAGLWPALIISDCRLAEGQDGIEVVQTLQNQMGEVIPACLMSGDTDPGLMQAAHAAKLTLLHKPVRPAKLRSLLRRLLVEKSSTSAGGQHMGVDDLP